MEIEMEIEMDVEMDIEQLHEKERSMPATVKIGSSGRHRQLPRGFTLVELLVVIGIIALLISILLPALSKARESGNAIKCAANLHNIGLGLNIYVSEWKGKYPAAYWYVNKSDEKAGVLHFSY